MDRIAIIGSTNVGLSFGLAIRALELKGTEIVASSGDRAWRDKAKQLAAFDDVGGHIGRALRGAQLVALDAPISQTHALLEAIAPVLEPECRVTTIGLALSQPIAWADSLLQPDASFVAGRPLLNIDASDLDAADGALFQGIDYCLAPSSSAHADGIKTVVGLVEAVGANPLFLDAQEHDSYAAAMAIAPSLLSSALMTTASSSPSWREMWRFAGREFREMSQFAASDPVETASAIAANRAMTSQWMQRVTAELAALQKLLDAPLEDLERALIAAWEARAKLEMGMVSEDNQPGAPSAGQAMASMFVGSRLAGRMKDINEANKQAPWRYPKKRDDRRK